MVKNSKKSKKKVMDDKGISEIDFSEGFGGIPENVSLTKNIGCASNSTSKAKKNQEND
jgi:hypothetical protein